MHDSCMDCYVGLGGNRSGTRLAIRRAVHEIRAHPQITRLQTSALYQTTPVSDIPQPLYLNAVCRFQTAIPLLSLATLLQSLERRLGKEEKAKNAPRLIDLDLLFYGTQQCTTGEWVVPHPRWQERLFVLVPLADVTHKVPIGREVVGDLLRAFTNPHRESIWKIGEVDAAD